MKKYLLIAAVALFALPFASQAQTGFSIGVYGGPVLSTVIADNLLFGDNSAFKSKIGGTGGLQVLYGFGEDGKVSANLGVGFTSKGWKSDVTNLPSGAVETVNGGLHYLDVPLNVRYLFDFGLFLEAGPTFSFLMGANYDGESEYDAVENGSATKKPYTDLYNSTDVGAGGGAGYMHSKGFGAVVRYTRGLTNIASDMMPRENPNEEATLANGCTSLTFFYLLGYQDK